MVQEIALILMGITWSKRGDSVAKSGHLRVVCRGGQYRTFDL